MMTSIRNRSHVFLWALLFLFLLSMSVGGLVGGANIIDQIVDRVENDIMPMLDRLPGR